MRQLILLIVAAACCAALAHKTWGDELEQATALAAETRREAAANPQVASAASPPVKAYLAEQQRRLLLRLAGITKRIAEYERDTSKQNLVPILRQQLADLEKRPPEPVSFDAAYGYAPATGLVGYSRKVRFLENASDGKSIILVESAALVVDGLGTEGYASGKFFSVEKAFLIGAQRDDYTFQVSPRKSYSATLIDRDAVLRK
jgi:hypothetical protein